MTSEHYLDTLVYRGFATIFLNAEGSEDSGFNVSDDVMDNRWCAGEQYIYAKVNISARLVLYK